jgi:hypothetical protein
VAQEKVQRLALLNIMMKEVMIIDTFKRKYVLMKEVFYGMEQLNRFFMIKSRPNGNECNNFFINTQSYNPIFQSLF